MDITPFTKINSMDHAPKCKIQSYKTSRRKMGENLDGLVFGYEFLDLTPKS